MGLSITGGIKNMFGAVGDVVSSPLRVLSGDLKGGVGGLIGAPFKLAGGALQTALGAVTLPIRLPFMFLGGMGLGGSAAALGGAQRGMAGHIPPHLSQQQGGAQQASPGYW